MARIALAVVTMAAGFTAGELLHPGPAPAVVASTDRMPAPPRVIVLRASRSQRRHPLRAASRPLQPHKARPATGLPATQLSRPARLQRTSLNWPALAECESGGNPRAADPSGQYFGLYQFDLTTWQAMGGAGSPADASPAEQTERAEKLYAIRGTAPWPVCGWHLRVAS
ncbi:MAG TPA: transglycosylase family protein [Mycobacteriales bacterium]|nr:transglycosylase family protein [Mycobacteriales bacterium]